MSDAGEYLENVVTNARREIEYQETYTEPPRVQVERRWFLKDQAQVRTMAATLLAVLALHSDTEGDGLCAGEYGGEQYPCETVRVITEGLKAL